MTNAAFIDRRLLTPEQRQRTERLQFVIRPVGRETWPMFSKYHYLSDKLPGGHVEFYGLFLGVEQIGFQCYANYVPTRKGKVRQMHSNRTVIHPDYAGLGMGIKLINATAFLMYCRGFDVRAKTSSAPIVKSRSRYKCWKLLDAKRQHKIVVGGNMLRRSGFRKDVKVYSYKFVGRLYHPEDDSVEFDK